MVKLVDESNIFTLQELKEARMLSDIIYKVYKKRYTTLELALENKIQRQEAEIEKRRIRNHARRMLRAQRQKRT